MSGSFSEKIGGGRPATIEKGSAAMKRSLAIVLAVAVAAIVGTAGLATAAQKSGTLHVTKECSEYDGTVGSFCTITSSNISAIRAGMRVVYLQAPTDGVLDSDIVLTSEDGEVAFGRVVLDLSTALGRVTLLGGAARGNTLSVDAAVSLGKGGLWRWDGTYSAT